MSVDLAELMRREEEILPELKPYEYQSPFGLGVHHPLVIELFYDPTRAALLNERYRQKTAAVSEAMQKRDWDSYIFLHERPYRIRALRTAVAHLLRDKQHERTYKLVKAGWTDSENIHQNKRAWQQIWSALPDPRGVMDSNERHVFDVMPEEITVHRGIRHRTHWPRGMSWTRDKERAVWFAHRLATSESVPTVLTATVSKRHAMAYLNARGEEEVVVMPRSLRSVTADERRKTAEEAIDLDAM